MVTISGPALGRDFFNREREIEEIVKLLESGENILLVAPRRYGKTSVMQKVKERLTKKNLCIFMDVMYVSKPEEFILALADAVFTEMGVKKRENFIRRLLNSFRKIEHISINFGDFVDFRIKLREALKEEINKENWAEKGGEILRGLAEIQKNPIIILIDELSECVNHMKNEDVMLAKRFLQWFRSMRNVHAKKILFIVGGSISFESVVRGIDLVLINDLRRVQIGGFSKDKALEFLKKCFEDENIDYDENFGEKILECIGEPYVPYFIAIFVNELVKEGEINLQKIEEVYNNRLLTFPCKGYFDYYRERLKKYKFAKSAEEILKEACKSEFYPIDMAFEIFKKTLGIDDYEKFIDLLLDLQNDMYIKLERKDGKDVIVFQSKILRDWWRLYYA